MLHCTLILFLLTAGAAQAQTAPLTATDVADPILLIILALVNAIIPVILAFILNFMSKRWNLQVEEKHLKTLQMALTNGAGLMVAGLRSRGAAITFDSMSPEASAAIRYVLTGAGDAVRHFQLEDRLEEMLAAKFGVITSPSGGVSADGL